MKTKNQFKSIKILESGKAIKCQLKNGKEFRYHSQWLRDNALDSETRDSNSGQRLIDHTNLIISLILLSTAELAFQLAEVHSFSYF